MSTHEDLLNSATIPWAIADGNVTSLAELGSRVHEEPTAIDETTFAFSVNHPVAGSERIVGWMRSQLVPLMSSR